MGSSPEVYAENMLKSMDSFMEICENAPDLHRHRDKLNTILNNLNTCDFKYVQSIELAKVSIERLQPV